MYPSTAIKRDRYFILAVYPEMYAIALERASVAPISSINSSEASLKSSKASLLTDLSEVTISLQAAYISSLG